MNEDIIQSLICFIYFNKKKFIIELWKEIPSAHLPVKANFILKSPEIISFLPLRGLTFDLETTQLQTACVRGPEQIHEFMLRSDSASNFV